MYLILIDPVNEFKRFTIEKSFENFEEYLREVKTDATKMLSIC